MNTICKDHQQQIEFINEQGKPMCRICYQAIQNVVEEYQGKKKSLLKRNQEDTLEKLTQAKKKMEEAQQILQMQMTSHIETVTKKREALLYYFSEQERKIDEYLGQEQDFLKFKQNGNSFSQDTTLQQIQEEKKNISQLQQRFHDILQKALNDYLFNASRVQPQNQQQVPLQQIAEKIQYQEFETIKDKAGVEFIEFNKDNNIIAYAESFEIHFIKIQDSTLLKNEFIIEDDDMELIQCMKFANQSNDIYYGTNQGKLNIWVSKDEKWEKQKKFQTHNGKDGKEITDLKLTDDDSRLFCSGDDKTVEIWSKTQTNDWQKVQTIEHKEFARLCSIAFNPKSKELISCFLSKVQIWNISDDYQGQSKQIIDEIKPNRNNKVHYINDRFFFVTSENQMYFYQKTDEEKFVKVETSTILGNEKYQLPVCYDPDLQVMLIQKKEVQEIDVMRFNLNENKFVHQMSITGEYNKIGIGKYSNYILLFKKADVNIFTVMKLE